MTKIARRKQKRRLFRSRSAFLGGVCGGIATYFDMDMLAIRVMAVLLAVFSLGLAVIIYVLLWVIIPLQPADTGPYDVRVNETRPTAYGGIDYYVLTDERGHRELARLPLRGLSWVGRVVVVVAFALFSVAAALVLGLIFPSVVWWKFWPVLPFVVGLLFIMLPLHSRYSPTLRGTGVVLTIASVAVLPIATGLFAPQTILFALDLFWPFLLATLLLFLVGTWWRSSPLIMFGACSFIAFCVLGAVFCVLPGPGALLDTPFEIFGTAEVGFFSFERVGLHGLASVG